MSLVERADDGPVAVLYLNRPERRNALSGALIDAIDAAIREAATDPAIHAIVVSGRGKAFCAGGDLADGLGASDGFLASHDGRGRYADLLGSLSKLRVPVIAALNGDALGGGLGLCAACDLIIADPGALLGTPEIKLGLFPMIITAILQRDVPRKPLLEMMLTGSKIDAARAASLGLVNRVSAPGAAVAEAVLLAHEIASKSKAIVALGKAAFYAVADLPQDAALRHLHAQLTLNLLAEDAAEGVAAFIGKREPQWKGR